MLAVNKRDGEVANQLAHSTTWRALNVVAATGLLALAHFCYRTEGSQEVRVLVAMGQVNQWHQQQLVAA